MNTRKGWFFGTIAILLNLLIIVSLTRSVWEVWQRRDIVTERKAELTVLEAENIKLKQALEEAQSREYIEREARNKLGMAKPGETVILFERREASESAASGNPDRRTNWQRWVGLFF
ncbi:hypothetical protein A2Z33_03270 [Candidatus Gottesmanbacteria bacterium RBG_16_52_11]|uniref:Cell division protein FtsL n=1 Tax=Candidatus Gottesmanbacteria bacterium RBG_16_52_11 TaxID=1798374 RepID=A0A1F5YVN0_9BACT|nr:MAG: hypothetical protein A2Z33_03270 [Candidatus Gottesmanbacteria bacterium RBG_16_52_11]